MSELPRHPDLGQLRRQARELLRAASAGEQQALARLRAYSERVSLSAAQLAVAREHGFPSWPVLRAAAEHRRRALAAESAPPRRLVVARRSRRYHDDGWQAVPVRAAHRTRSGLPGCIADAVAGDFGRSRPDTWVR